MKRVQSIHGVFIDGTSILYENTKRGIVKHLLFEDGSTFSMHRYTAFGDFIDGLAWCERNGKVGYINRKGIEVIEPKFHIGDDFREERAAVSYRDNPMLINTEGDQLAVYNELDLICEFNEGIARVIKFSEDMKMRRDGFINRSGELVIETKYEKIVADALELIDDNDRCSEGLVRVTKDEKYGFIDIAENLIIDYEYQWVSNFGNGKAAAKRNGKAGYINKGNEEIIPFKYVDAIALFKNFYIIKDEKGWIFLNENGEQANENYYESIKPINNNMAAVKKNGKWGVMDIEMKLLIPYISLKTPVYREGLFTYMKNSAIIITDLNWHELHSKELFQQYELINRGI